MLGATLAPTSQQPDRARRGARATGWLHTAPEQRVSGAAADSAQSRHLSRFGATCCYEMVTEPARIPARDRRCKP